MDFPRCAFIKKDGEQCRNVCRPIKNPRRNYPPKRECGCPPVDVCEQHVVYRRCPHEQKAYEDNLVIEQARIEQSRQLYMEQEARRKERRCRIMEERWNSLPTCTATRPYSSGFFAFFMNGIVCGDKCLVRECGCTCCYRCKCKHDIMQLREEAATWDATRKNREDWFRNMWERQHDADGEPYPSNKHLYEEIYWDDDEGSIP